MILLSGVTAYDPVELGQWADATAGGSSSAGHLEAVADAIELRYREDGFLAAEARVGSDQATGQAMIQVHEGRLVEIDIEGARPKTAVMIHRYVDRLQDGRPLRIRSAQRQLLLASDRAGIELASQFTHRPGGEGTILQIGVSERRHDGFLSIDNIPLRPKHSIRIVGQEEIYGVATGGDIARVTIVHLSNPSGGDGWAGQAFYRAPIGGTGAYFEAYGGSAITRRRFNGFVPDYDQTGTHLGFALGQAVTRTMKRQSFIVGEYEYAAGRSRTDQARLRSAVHAARLHWTAARFLPPSSTLEGSITASAGVRAARGQFLGPDGKRRWAHLRAEGGIATPIGRDFVFRVEGEGQLALTGLPEIEHFYLGHLPVVRGYAQGEAGADSGGVVSIQLERSIQISPATTLAPFAFTGAGFTRRKGANAPYVTNEQLASVGAGAEVSTRSGWSARSWIAVPLTDGPLSKSGHPTFYFRLTRSWGK
jgi:hemolysin activation/secretion protein